MTEKVGAPPYLKDIIWPDMWDEGYKPPRKFRGGLTKRDLALFIKSRDFDWDVLKIWFRQVPYEPWRMLILTQMRFELKSGPLPSWMQVVGYHRHRMRNIEEADEEDQIITYESDEGYQRPKKPTRRDIIDAKYNRILAAIRDAHEKDKR